MLMYDKNHYNIAKKKKNWQLYSAWNSLDPNTEVGRLTFLQQIFPTQELNQGLLHCRQILYQLSYQGSPPKLADVHNVKGVHKLRTLRLRLWKSARAQNKSWEKVWGRGQGQCLPQLKPQDVHTGPCARNHT